VSELLGKVGVRMNEIKSGPLKAVPSPFQPLDQAGRDSTQRMVADSMNWFRGLVADRRKLDTAAVPGLEQGRIFSGREALDHKLIDAIGGETEVVRYLVDKKGVGKGLRIVDWKPRRDDPFNIIGWLGRALAGAAGLGGDAGNWLTGDSTLGALAASGLVSIWQPAKNE
jgi:protease-4